MQITIGGRLYKWYKLNSEYENTIKGSNCTTEVHSQILLSFPLQYIITVCINVSLVKYYITFITLLFIHIALPGTMNPTKNPHVQCGQWAESIKLF